MTRKLHPSDVTAIIVNYNTAPFAIDAALSALGAGAARAIIVDNASTDESLSYFAATMTGRVAPLCEVPAAPVDNGDIVFADIQHAANDASSLGTDGEPRLIVLPSPVNRGFAAGCNQGLAFWRGRVPTRVGLLLNPDALVSANSLEAFCRRLETEDAGLCGASVVEFDAPHRVQAAGGAVMTSMFHQGRNIAEGLAVSELPDPSEVEKILSYPLGASIAFRAEYLDEAGYLDEQYFLYYEEADWTLAGAASAQLRPVWARDAIVYHRYGAASGSEKRVAGVPSARSTLSDFHMARSRLLFAEKWRPLTKNVNKAAIGAQAATRVWRGRLDNARAVWRALEG